MIEDIEGMGNTVIPYRGFEAGYNVVLYNDNSHSLNEVMVAFMNTNFFSEIQALHLTIGASQQGYIVVPCRSGKSSADKIIKSFRKVGLQCECIFSKGIDPIEPQKKEQDFFTS